MLKRTFSGAIVGLAASLGLATAVHATTVTFNDVDFQGNDYLYTPNDYFYGGLHFSDESMVVMPANWQGYPLNNSSKFFEFGSQPDVHDTMDISLDGGGAFDFLSMMLGLGDGNSTDVFDNVTITGHKAANCQTDCTDPTVVLQVGYNFQFYALNGFTGLSGVTISQQLRPGQLGLDTGWLAMDDVSFRAIPPDNGGGAVPEPSAWAMMIVGFGGVGALIRRRGRQTAALSGAA